MRKIFVKTAAVLITVCAVLTGISVLDTDSKAYAQEKRFAASGMTDEIIEAERNGRFGGNVPEEFYGPMTFALDDSVVHADRYKDYIIEKGIDVSVHNDYVDWNAVAADGIEFTFIRAGGKYWVSGENYADGQMKTNIERAQAVGIKTGVYFYSQAITVEEAIEEAEYTLDLIKGYNMQMPVVIDFEYASDGGLTGRLYEAKKSGKIDKRDMTDICLAFCETVEKAGYDAAVYANASMLGDDLYADEISAKYDIWLAHYTTQSDYEGEYSYWQYTDKGTVNGISGNVDMNYRYVSHIKAVTGLKITNVASTGKLKLTWNSVFGADKYYVYRAKSKDGEYTYIGKTEGTTYTDERAIAEKQYYYKVRAVSSDNSNANGALSGYVGKVCDLAKVSGIKITNVASTGKLKLTWNSVFGADKYYVYRAKSKDGEYTYIGKTEGTTYTDERAIAEKQYYYKVRAVSSDNSNANGALSGYVGKVCDLAKISSIKISNTSTTGKPKLTWCKVFGADKYYVYRAKSKDGEYTYIGKTEGTTYTDERAIKGEVYYYKVRAISSDNSNAHSVYSPVVCCTSK